MLLTFIILAPGMAFAQTSGLKCVSDVPSCSANDLDVHEAIFTLVAGTCATTGDVISVSVQSRMEPNASIRYDLATIISTDGDAIQRADWSTSTGCYAEILSPLGGTHDTSGGAGPYYDQDGDACGDVRSADGNTVQDLNGGVAINVVCKDTNADGMVDINSCWTFDNNSNTTCGNVTEAVQGTNAKCFCGDVATTIPILDILPVELSIFEASVQGKDVKLTWTTETETNNAGFEIEHALPGAIDFDYKGFVQGAGTTLEVQNYEFSVLNLVPGQHRFRLKQNDHDGSTTYSLVVEAGVDVPGDFFLSEVYPNPFNPQASFQVAVAGEQDIEIALYNSAGQVVKQIFEGVLPAGQTRTLQINGDNLPTGNYFLRLLADTFSETRQVVLSK